MIYGVHYSTIHTVQYMLLYIIRVLNTEYVNKIEHLY